MTGPDLPRRTILSPDLSPDRTTLPPDAADRFGGFCIGIATMALTMLIAVLGQPVAVDAQQWNADAQNLQGQPGLPGQQQRPPAGGPAAGVGRAGQPLGPGQGGPGHGHAAASEVEPGTLVPPRSPTGWYSAQEIEAAKQASVTLGQPMALMLTEPNSSCPKCQRQTQTWMRARELGSFIRVLVATNGPSPQLLRTLRQQAGGKEGRFIPMLFLGTASGEYLGCVPYGAPPAAFMSTVGAAVKKYGPVVPPKAMMAAWQKLAKGRTLWSEGQIGPALRAYRDVRRIAEVNESLAIAKEWAKELPKINETAEQELAEVQAMFDAGEHRKARAEFADLRHRYAGFEAGEQAKKLQDQRAENTDADPLADTEPGATTPDPSATTDSAPAAADVTSAKRTWTDRSGQHQIEAELVAVKSDWVQLRRPSGELIALPIAKLSEADQSFVAEQTQSTR